jgi:hypothetical protein
VQLTKADHNVLQPEIAHPLAQASQILGHDVFCDDAAVGSDNRRQPYDVVSATRADVRDRRSPASSRSFSSCQIGLTMSATGRSGFGKATAGTPDCASCAAPEMANAAAKTTPIVIRIMTASTQVLNGLCVDSAKPRGEAIEVALQAVPDFRPSGPPLPTHGPPSLTHFVSAKAGPVTHNEGGAVTRNATSKTRTKNAGFDARERHLQLEKTRGAGGERRHQTRVQTLRKRGPVRLGVGT